MARCQLVVNTLKVFFAFTEERQLNSAVIALNTLCAMPIFIGETSTIFLWSSRG